MRKGIMALEELDEVVAPVDGNLDVDIQKIELNNQEIETQADTVEEARDIRESVGEIVEVAEGSLEDGGLTEDAAKSVEIAIEHFTKRLGYKKKIIPAMESFQDSKTRLEKTKLALENLNNFSLRLDKSISIAQEGLLDSLIVSFQMMFETDDKVLTKLYKVSKNYDSRGARTEAIPAGAWGKYLNANNSKYSGKDALSKLKEIENVIDNEDIVKNIQTLSECMIKLTREVRGNWFVSNKEDIKRIADIHENIKDVRDKILLLVSEKGIITIRELTPLNKDEKNKIFNLLIKLLKDTHLDTVIKEFTGEKKSLQIWSLWQSQFRLKSVVGNAIAGPAGSMLATLYATEDVANARKASNDANAAVKAIADIISSRIKLCSALVSYMEASIA